MLRETLKNLFLLKRINDTTSTYRRDKYLNDWVVGTTELYIYLESIRPIRTAENFEAVE